jgi:hypothetical protein
MMSAEPNRPIDEYVEAAVQRLLTEHTEIAEQGIGVARREHTLVLCGEVESPRRRDDIMRIVTSHFPDVRFTTDIGVTRAGPPSEAEELT